MPSEPFYFKPPCVLPRSSQKEGGLKPGFIRVPNYRGAFTPATQLLGFTTGLSFPTPFFLSRTALAHRLSVFPHVGDSHTPGFLVNIFARVLTETSSSRGVPSTIGVGSRYTTFVAAPENQESSSSKGGGRY